MKERRPAGIGLGAEVFLPLPVTHLPAIITSLYVPENLIKMGIRIVIKSNFYENKI